jgi:hypothetical protein
MKNIKRERGRWQGRVCIYNNLDRAILIETHSTAATDTVADDSVPKHQSVAPDAIYYHYYPHMVVHIDGHVYVCASRYGAFSNITANDVLEYIKSDRMRGMMSFVLEVKQIR